MNMLLLPFSEPLVFVAVMVKFPWLEMDTLCETSTPVVKEAVVPMPDDKVPEDVILAVPEKIFGPEVHALLFASLAVILMLKGIPVTCDPMFPPETPSTRKLETTPGFTDRDKLDIPEFVPSVRDIVVASAFFNVVVNTVEETPLAKLTFVV